MRRQLVALTFVAVPLAVTMAELKLRATGDAAQAFKPSMGVELDALDRKTDPCLDFYQYACGGWIAKNPIPADRRAIGRFQEVQERNFLILRRILETTPADSTDADQKKAADYYAACMDESAIDGKGLMPLAHDLATIDALVNPDDLPILVAYLHTIGVPAFFRFNAQTDLRDATQQIADVDQAGLSLPDREYYLKTDPQSAEIRTKFAAHVERMFLLAGQSAEHAGHARQSVMSIETRLAEASLDRVRRRDPAQTQHPMTLRELQAISPAFDWKRYAEASESPAFQALNVSVPDYVNAFGRLIESTPVDDLKDYLRWHLLSVSAQMLPKTIADADFDFFSRTLAGQQQPEPRWRRCVTQTDQRLGEALGKAFVAEAFGPQAKADMLKMVQDIKGAMRQDIDAAPWMSGETKKAAMAKLDAVVDRIGYPEKWRDYSAVRVTRDDALGNLQRAIGANRRRSLAKIGQAVDRSEWSMTPPTVNAYYSPDRNNINFPAGILQPPFYRSGRDAAVNYGGAGAVIGHELTHGFDDQGRKFDGQGNLRDWWTAADAKAYEERAACVAEQYSGYTAVGDTRINGQLTLGENTADNGGLRLALMAYLAGPGARKNDKIDGFTPEQRVFIGWAQVWCENARPEAERLKAATNPHSSNKYRVIGPLSNMPEFRKAFSCKADAPMVRSTACRVW